MSFKYGQREPSNMHQCSRWPHACANTIKWVWPRERSRYDRIGTQVLAQLRRKARSRKIHERVGGEVYIALPVYNDIHGTICASMLLPYTVFLSLAHLPYTLRVCALTCPLLPFFGGSISPCSHGWLLFLRLILIVSNSLIPAMFVVYYININENPLYLLSCNQTPPLSISVLECVRLQISPVSSIYVILHCYCLIPNIKMQLNIFKTQINYHYKVDSVTVVCSTVQCGSHVHCVSVCYPILPVQNSTSTVITAAVTIDPRMIPTTDTS